MGIDVYAHIVNGNMRRNRGAMRLPLPYFPKL